MHFVLKATDRLLSALIHYLLKAEYRLARRACGAFIHAQLFGLRLALLRWSQRRIRRSARRAIGLR